MKRTALCAAPTRTEDDSSDFLTRDGPIVGRGIAGARHCHHPLAYDNHARQYAQGSYGAYAPAPVETPRYHDPFGTYDVEPSPVTDR